MDFSSYQPAEFFEKSCATPFLKFNRCYLMLIINLREKNVKKKHFLLFWFFFLKFFFFFFLKVRVECMFLVKLLGFEKFSK